MIICPKCNSSNLKYQGEPGNARYAVCNDCGHKFQVSWLEGGLTMRAADDATHCECGEVLDIDGMCPDIANVSTHRR